MTEPIYIPAEYFRECIKWCVSKVEDDEWNWIDESFKYYDPTDNLYYISFDNDEDAVAFKLKFGL